MGRQHRRVIRLFSGTGTGKRTGIGLAGSTDYWPLTIVSSTSRSKRSMAVWIVAGAVAAIGAALTLALRQGIPAWGDRQHQLEADRASAANAGGSPPPRGGRP